MDKVKAGLRGLNAVQKAGRAAVVYDQMNGNPHFPNPVPSMPEFHAAYIELKESVLAALDRGRMALARRNRAEERMDMYLSGLAGYVNTVAMGDKLKLISSGFPLAKQGAPVSSLNKPSNVTVRATPFPGQVKMRWERVPGALIYQVERALDIHGQQWERIGLTSRLVLVVEDVQPHTMQWFRVCAIGTKTQSPYGSAFGKAA